VNKEQTPESEILSKIYIEILYHQISNGRRLETGTAKTIRNDLKIELSR
jgi:hypothetical protein